MAKDSKTVGHIPGVMQPASQPPAALRKQIEDGRAKALKGINAVFDTERLTFYIHGKHPMLAGMEAQVAVPLADMLSMLAGVLPNVIVPIVLSAMGQLTATAPAGKNS